MSSDPVKHDANLSDKAQFSPAALVERAEANRGELVSRCQQALRQHLFTNRTEIHPRNLAVIASQAADGLINFLWDPAFSGQAHGAFLCNQGLSSRSVFGLSRAYREFIFSLWSSNQEIVDLSDGFLREMLEGFFLAREKKNLDEQESFRLTFQLALNNSTAQIQEARKAVQDATEASYRNIILAQEEERRRISRELHDEAGGALTGIRMNLENVLHDTKIDRSTRREYLEKAIVSTDNVLKEIRSLAYNLRPPVLDLLGIHLTIKQLCRDFSDQTKLTISYSGVELPPLADEVAITIYRVVQEALTNIFKHAKAKHVWVKLALSEKTIELLIKDDGRGFDTENAHRGLGLMGMQERLRLLNGSFKVESIKGKSSQISVQLPLVLKNPDGDRS